MLSSPDYSPLDAKGWWIRIIKLHPSWEKSDGIVCNLVPVCLLDKPEFTVRRGLLDRSRTISLICHLGVVVYMG